MASRNDKGKPIERWGRKVMGLRPQGAMIARLPKARILNACFQERLGKQAFLWMTSQPWCWGQLHHSDRQDTISPRGSKSAIIFVKGL